MLGLEFGILHVLGCGGNRGVRRDWGGSLGGWERTGWEWTGSARDSDHEMWVRTQSKVTGSIEEGFIAQKGALGPEFLSAYAGQFAGANRKKAGALRSE